MGVRVYGRQVRQRKSQKGYVAILLLTVLILGVTWYTVGALSSPRSSQSDADAKTSVALKRAKDALLAYVALTAASTGELYPGRLPCPEKLARGGTTAEGQAAELTDTTCDAVGRLPWKTLGVDKILDGYGEPLWYAVPTGTWAYSNVPTTLTINPGLANQLTYDGTVSSVVAVIIAPGPALNTLGLGTPPAGCSGVNQQVASRNSSLAVANFLECGDASGSYVSVGTSSYSATQGLVVQWSNDRSVSITAAEVMSAIAGAVASRIQRQVVPTLANWDALELAANAKSWNSTWGISFLPFASAFTNPATNTFCGTGGASPSREGMPPIASTASATCSSNWSVPTYSIVGGSLTGASCTSSAANVQCSFSRVFAVLGQVTITTNASHVAGGFRGTISSADVIVSAGGTKAVTMSVGSNPDEATITVTTTWPAITNLITWLLTGGTPVTVTIPHVADAAVLSNSNVTWFTNNNWHQYVYYQVAPGSTISGSSPACTSSNTANCLTVSGLPTSNGSTNDKRIVLTYWGPALTTENRTTNPADLTQYLESHTSGSTTYTMQTVTSSYNDRILTCPFIETWADSSTTTICN